MTKPKAQTVINILLVFALAFVGTLNVRQERRIQELEAAKAKLEAFDQETVQVVGSIINYLRGGRPHGGSQHGSAPQAITPASR